MKKKTKEKNIQEIRSSKKVYTSDVLRELEEERKALKRKRVKRAIIIIAILLVIAGALTALYFVMRAHKYSAVKEISRSETDTNVALADLNGEIIKYSQDGMSLINKDYETKWTKGFEMSDPTVKTCKDYMLVYDKNGTSIEVLNKDGTSQSFSCQKNILAADISEYGVTSVLTSEENSGMVNFYDKTGRKLDIEVKNVLAESSGFPISMCMSPSGEGLTLSLLFADLGSIKTRLSFLNFDAGKDASDRVVGFYEYEGIIFPEIDYISDNRAVAFGDDRAVFFSLSEPSSPTMIKEVIFDEEIETVITGSHHASVITKSKEGGKNLHLYDSEGEEIISYIFDFEYTNAEIDGGYLMIYGGEDMLIINTAGYIKYHDRLVGKTDDMISIGMGKFMQSGEYGLRKIQFAD